MLAIGLRDFLYYMDFADYTPVGTIPQTGLVGNITPHLVNELRVLFRV